MGNANICSELNTLMYEVEFPDGEIRPYAAKVIADNIWAQTDPDGQPYVIFESMIDHHVDNSIAASKENMHCFVNNQRTMQRSTVGVKLLCLLKDESKQWFPLKNLKESNPVECSKYTKARNIDAELAFYWWAPYTLRKKERIIAIVKSQLEANSHKYGIKVPRDLAHEKTRQRKWKHALGIFPQ